jgi:hypothetical protein
LLERIDRQDLADLLATRLARQRVRPVLLASKHKPGRAKPHPGWRVVPNVKVEVDR